MLAFAPWVRGGNRPLPLLALECGAILLAVATAFRGDAGAWRRVAPALRWAVAILVLVPLLQLVPVPPELWAAIPGHEPYARAMALAGVVPGWHSISLNAAATEYAWLALLPPVAMFAAVQGLESRRVRTLLLIVLAVALLQGILGILQLGAQPGSALYFGNPYGGGAATGTYVNRNHFAGLMEMALPVAMALWAAEVVPPRDADGEILREHPRHRDVRLARRVALTAALAVLAVALLFSLSRAGATCGFAALAAASLVLVWNAGSAAARAMLALVAALAVLLGAYIGLTPVFERFAPGVLSVSYEGRVALAAAAIRGALDFLPLGSGLGTFADVFPRYQAGTVAGFVDHAHNDYAEAFLELGVGAVAVLGLAIAAYLGRWRVLARGRLSRRLGYLRVGAGLAVAALAVHGGFDFNFHIPANALYWAFFAGVFWLTPDEDRG
ncbi:MAG TPA: O-antigen ligase family protein [Usitatibacter sp.]|nr:O-antigen ligase family protein [Usitatibacter sp.]